MNVVPVVDEGLGNTSYLVDLGDGRALAVDASRDIRALGEVAVRLQLTVAFAADTHLHADYLSGARQLAAADGAQILGSAAGQREFDHVGLRDGDTIDLGGLTLQAWATPGHTDEHLAYVLLDDSRPLGVFTGGSLIVGAAARTDLVDMDRTEELTRAQYASLQRLLTLPDDVAVWPTHGAGSFCSAPPGAHRVSTIGQERATNHLLRARDADEFAPRLVAALGSYPAYFRWLTEINRRGPDVFDAPPRLRKLSSTDVQSLLANDAIVVDVRPIDQFAANHIAGSLSIELRDVFATWLGWLAPPNRPIVVVRAPDQESAEIAWQAAKIGYDLAGELEGGITGWTELGLPVDNIELGPASRLGAGTLVDVRQQSEYAVEHVVGSLHIELGNLADNLHALPEGQLVFMCGHGERAMSAASLVRQHGRRPISVVLGGPDEWAATHRGELVSTP